MTVLSLPPYDFLETASRYHWVEMGAGTGLWLRIMREYGIDVIGYDPVPGGPDVMQGDHRELAKHPDRACLIVWPPNRTQISDWLEFYEGNMVAVCAHPGRVVWPELSDEWVLGDEWGKGQGEWGDIAGPKGGSMIKLWRRGSLIKATHD